jgi:hypothetical protein
MVGIRRTSVEKVEFKVLSLFIRYLTWIHDNNLKDNFENYIFYIDKVENVLINPLSNISNNNCCCK